MDTVDILKAARAKIARPEDWGKGRRVYDRPKETCCAAEAIEEVAGDPWGFEEFNRRKPAFRALYNAAGLEWEKKYPDSLPEWNDAPERTHAQVLAAFDLAIAALRL